MLHKLALVRLIDEPLQLRFVLFFVFLLVCTRCATAGPGVLHIVVRSTDNKPLRHITIEVTGASTAVTTDSGEALIRLPDTWSVGHFFYISVVHPDDLLVASPWSGKMFVTDSSSGPVEVIVARRGDRQILENMKLLEGVNEISRAYNSRTEVAPDTGGTAEEQRRLAVVAAAQAFGLSPEEVSRALSGVTGEDTLGTSPLVHSAEPGVKSSRLDFIDGIPEFADEKEFVLNGIQVKVQHIDRSTNLITVLGPDDRDGLIHDGLNTLARKTKEAQQEYLYWSEERKLQRFQNPYKNSYAIISAIDDYDRERDPGHRGKTGFRPLNGTMVQGAKDLVIALKSLGFPAQNIFTFYDVQATSTALNNALYEFWQGHRLESADRVFFYFGGHGTQEGHSGLLVTYDYDPKQPTTTAFLAKDLSGRHSENILAHHVLFALDSCHAGLALNTLDDSSPNEVQLKSFRQLSTIRSNTEPVARNLLLAGAGDQKALWENGGIFTKALVAGLAGNADLNHDGLIEFDELALYIRHEVIFKASATGVRQDPESDVLTQFGKGRMLFILNK